MRAPPRGWGAHTRHHTSQSSSDCMENLQMLSHNVVVKQRGLTECHGLTYHKGPWWDSPLWLIIDTLHLLNFSLFTFCVLISMVIQILLNGDESSRYESSPRYCCYVHSCSHNYLFVCPTPGMDKSFCQPLDRLGWLFANTCFFLVIQLTKNSDFAIITLVKALLPWVAWFKDLLTFFDRFST